MNPKGVDGKFLLCKSCGSYRHMINTCPDSWENRKSSASDNIASGETRTEEENYVLFTMLASPSEENCEEVVVLSGYDESSVKSFVHEAKKCVVLDSACSSTVCGEWWMEDFVSSLSDEERKKIVKTPSNKVFKFGGGRRLKSLFSVRIPARIVGKNILIQTDVVDSDIPLLLSKPAMKNAGVKLDLPNDSAEIFGVRVMLNETSSGHYCLPINDSVSFESVNLSGIFEMKAFELKKTILRLHRQFAHPSKEKLITLMKDAKYWQDSFEDILSDIYESCDTCKRFQRTPSRPVVAMPMAREFNEKVAMDLKKWKGMWILHMIDMWSRFSVSVFIKRK